MNIRTILKDKALCEDYGIEKFGMSDDMIIELIGFEEIAYPEDLQYFINEVHWEMEALTHEAELEFA